MYSGNLKTAVLAQSSSTRSVPARDGSVESHFDTAGVVSFQAELPVPLQTAMTNFIERYPNWDQYRLIQAALAGFLVQNGIQSRSMTRLYLGNMFRSESFVDQQD